MPESAYEWCLALALGERGIRFERQKRLPIVYKGTPLVPSVPSAVEYRS